MLHSDLSMIVRGGDIFMSRCLDDFGITAAEVTILMYLYGYQHPRQEDISDFFMIDKGSIAKTLHKLEDKGLISREANPSDKREKVITVTEKGLAVREVCQNLVRLWHEALFNGISDDEMRGFLRVIGKMAGNAMTELEKWGTLYGKAKEQ